MGASKDVMVGLDIGASSTTIVVARALGDRSLETLGIGVEPSLGARKGEIVNIEATVESIRSAAKEAETMSGCSIESVCASIAGSSLIDINSHGVIATRGGEVKRADIDRALEAARAVSIPMDRRVIHLCAQEFLVDNQSGVLDPVGMNCVRLETKAHIITASASSLKNIERAIERAGLRMALVAPAALASAAATLDDDEKELGVALVDIGAGVSDIAIYHNSAIRATRSVPLGGANITNDISIGLRAPAHEAEKLKLAHGCALSALVGSDETLSAPSLGGRAPKELARKVLADIIEPRASEMLNIIKREIDMSGFGDRLAGGVALTGGGALLPGLIDLAENIFEAPTRLAMPRALAGLSDLAADPSYSTAIGLTFIQGARSHGAGEYFSDRVRRGDWLERARGWFRDFF